MALDCTTFECGGTSTYFCPQNRILRVLSPHELGHNFEIEEMNRPRTPADPESRELIEEFFKTITAGSKTIDRIAFYSAYD